MNWAKLKPILIFLAPSFVLGLGVGLIPGYKLYHFAWYDAGFCLSCHVHDYANIGWSESVHGDKTTCHDCHHQRLRDYINESIVMIMKQPKFPQDLHHTPYIKKELCAACHVSDAADRSTISGPMSYEDVEKIPKVDESYLHRIHLEKTTDYSLLNSHEHSENEKNPTMLKPNKELPRNRVEERQITCADCHGGPANRGHNFSSVDSSCIRCHDTQKTHNFGEKFGCRSCHFQSFMIPADQTEQHKYQQKLRIWRHRLDNIPEPTL